MKEKKIIELYLKYLDNKENYQKNFNEPFNNLETIIKLSLEELSVKELIALYFEHTTVYHFKKNTNIEEFFKLVYDIIISKLKELSLMKLIDLTAYMMDSFENAKIVYDSNNSIVKTRKINLENEFFLQNEFSNNPTKKEVYINELNASQEIVSIYEEKILKVLDVLVDNVLIYIDVILEKTDIKDLDLVLTTINSRIDNNSKKILKILEHLNNKKLLNAESNLYNSSVSETRTKLNSSVSTLINMNKTYESYQQTIVLKQKEENNLK